MGNLRIYLLFLISFLAVADGYFASPSYVSAEDRDDMETVLLIREEEDRGYQGVVETVPGSNSKVPIVTFRGIPYATAPIGELRFKPPSPYIETRIRDALFEPSFCLQYDFYQRAVIGSEDCLFLNIFKPYDKTKANMARRRKKEDLLPVMVFFSGVGFIAGQSDTYHPGHIVQKGVVVVTVQYRLGTLGFLSSGDELQPGNMGLLDQVEALRWVKRYIKNFDGDPTKVTIFGHSSGAISVGMHLMSPLTKGLFRAAVIESGSPLAPHAIQKSPISHVEKLAENLGCTGATKELLQCIYNADPKDIVFFDANSGQSEKKIKGHKRPTNPGPVIQRKMDTDWPIFLDDDPAEALEKGHFHQIPVIIGVTRDESASAFLNNVLPRVLNATENDSSYPERVFLKKIVKSSGTSRNSEAVRAAVKFEYFRDYNMSEMIELKDRYINLHSDFSIIAPVYRTALLLSRKTRVYFYTFEYEGQVSLFDLLMKSQGRANELTMREFSRRSISKKNSKRNVRSSYDPQTNSSLLNHTSSSGAVKPEILDLSSDDQRYVIHGEELLYLFRFRNPATGTVVEINDDEGRGIRNLLATLWSNLAKYGLPTPMVNGTSFVIPNWKPFSERKPYCFKIAHDEISLQNSFQHRKMLFWTKFIPELESIRFHCSKSKDGKEESYH